MKNKLLKMLIVGLAVCSLFSISGMLTQDEGAAFGTEVDRLIALGVSKEPTCTADGEKTIYCSVCSEPIRTETIEATGHENTYVNTVNPGFFTPGREEVTCIKCYEILETKEIPVPMWQYIVAGSVAALVLIAAIAVLVIKAKNKEK